MYGGFSLEQKSKASKKQREQKTLSFYAFDIERATEWAPVGDWKVLILVLHRVFSISTNV